MEYVLEVSEPWGLKKNWFHNVIIDDPEMTPDATESLWVDLEHHPDVVICFTPVCPGDMVYGSLATVTQFMFWAKRDMTELFPAILAAALVPDKFGLDSFG